MPMQQFFDAVDRVQQHIRETQADAIRAAAATVAESLAQGGAWYIMDTGHMLQHEAITRAGGLVGLTPFNYALEITGANASRLVSLSKAEAVALEAKLVDAALTRSTLRRGDVLLINSNSGRSVNIIEVALQCRARGIHTIGLASLAQMTACAASHPSGQKLIDVVDYFLDNGGPVGDAAVPVEGNEAMCPMSGLAATYVFWAMHAEAVDRLVALGIQPTIYRSVHTGSEAFMQEQEQRYRERGI